MTIDDQTTFEVSRRGIVDDAAIERAREQLERVGRHCREDILHAELRITNEPTHPGQDQARAEATLSVKRGPVRAHALGATVGEAVDLMIERLRRRVDRHESRLHRTGTKRHDGVAVPGSWHHGDVAATPRHPRAITEHEGTIVRRKTFAVAPMPLDEAAFDLEVLDHDFYLFEEYGSGATGLLSIQADGRYQLEIADGAVLEVHPEIPFDRVDGPMVLDEEAAKRLLDACDAPFVFHRIGAEQPGQVMYRRYDGNYGVVELAST